MIKTFDFQCDLTEASFIAAIEILAKGEMPKNSIKLVCHWATPISRFLRLAGAEIEIRPHEYTNVDYWEMHYGEDIIYSNGVG